MKKLLSFTVLLISIFFLAGCGSSNENSSKILDLTGTWKETETSDLWHEAYIKEDSILIYWISNDSESLYWKGTYQNPKGDLSEYSWTSKNTIPAGQIYLLANYSDNLEFKYEGGYITYRAEYLGVVKKVKLEKISSTINNSENIVGHSHSFNKEVAEEKYLLSPATCTSSAKYYLSCSCGEKGTESFSYGKALGHDYSNKNTDSKYLASPATCTEQANYFYSCSRCGDKGTNTFCEGALIPHEYNQKNTDSKYLASSATCIGPAKYYYSCTCGEKGVSTFNFGLALGHNMGQWELKKGTNKAKDYKLSACTRCDHEDKVEIEEVQSSNNLLFTILSEEDKTCAITGYQTYYGDDRDNNISIPAVYGGYTVVSIAENAFLNRAKIVSVSIPNTVTSIGDSAFSMCSALENISFENDSNLTSIGFSAFTMCSSLRSFIVPKTVTVINSLVFAGCTSLESLKVADGNLIYDSRNDCNAIIETANNRLIFGYEKTVIPNNVTKIAMWAFNNSSIKTIVIPKSVTYIEGEAFWSCKLLTDVYYEGSEEDWNSINFNWGNDPLKNATIHFNYINGE